VPPEQQKRQTLEQSQDQGSGTPPGFSPGEVGKAPGEVGGGMKEVFRYAKAHGLRCWPHAGETDGPASIWGAVQGLGADRIAHGIRTVEDPALLAYLAEHGIGCDVCPTSNLSLGVYTSDPWHTVAA
jgi:adenosine deaminase